MVVQEIPVLVSYYSQTTSRHVGGVKMVVTETW